MGKHKPQKCSICQKIFENGRMPGHHKIEDHDYTMKQLGWGLQCGWNKGMTQVEAFNVTGIVRHGNAKFMNRLNSPEYLKIKRKSRHYHEEIVLHKEKELRAKGYRTFCTSNYAHHNRVPDIIAISSEGKVVAVELETIKHYRSSREAIQRKYTSLLMKEGFFDDVLVEFFAATKFTSED